MNFVPIAGRVSRATMRPFATAMEASSMIMCAWSIVTIVPPKTIRCTCFFPDWPEADDNALLRGITIRRTQLRYLHMFEGPLEIDSRTLGIGSLIFGLGSLGFGHQRPKTQDQSPKSLLLAANFLK